MGWDYCREWRTPEDVKNALLHDLNNHICAWGWGTIPDPIDGERTLWMALDTTGSSNVGVIALCVLVGKARGPHAWWGYKMMSEDMGPYYYDVPPQVWESLTTPPPGAYAQEWRDKVIARRRGIA